MMMGALATKTRPKIKVHVRKNRPKNPGTQAVEDCRREN